jgi:FixJ family two-component response regulator
MARKLFISIVDDDVSLGESLPDLLRQFDFHVETFPSAEVYLASDAVGRTECLILDITLPGMGGLELQRELRRRGLDTPVIFMTAEADNEEVDRRQIEHEVVAYLIKPFETATLLEAISAAVLLLAVRASLRRS